MTSARKQEDHSSMVICEACGARKSVPQGDGSYVCLGCGWVQHDRLEKKPNVARKPRNAWLAAATVMIVLAASFWAWRHFHSNKTSVKDPAGPTAITADEPEAADRGNRQVTVKHPAIRVVDRGLGWTLAELFADKLPLFDSSQLELGKFERIIDETGLPTYRAALTNRSKDKVVMHPGMNLQLFSTDGTSQIPASIGGMPPSLYPGEKAWIKVGDDEDIKAIARVEIQWDPSRSEALPGPRRKANLEVKTQKMRTCHKRIINVEGDFSFSYQCVDLLGVLRNTDTRAMHLVNVAAFYYDDNSRYVGSDSTNIDKVLNPGEQVDFEINSKLLRKHGYKRFELHYYAR